MHRWKRLKTASRRVGPGCRLARRLRYATVLLGLTSLLTACSSLQKTPVKSLAVKPIAYAEEVDPPRRRGKTSRPYRIRGKTYRPMLSSKGYREVGVASWYGFESGNRTATGEHFKPHALSAAHKTLPLPTRVRVTNLANGKSAELIVNDRGPFVQGRLIDLSLGAAKRLDIYRRGSARVLVEALN
jgi:rare lipoprotein A